jgi:hypothetical protein
MERNDTCQEVQRIFRPDFNFARCERSQHLIPGLFPTVLPALNGLNDKPVMSKPAQFANCSSSCAKISGRKAKIAGIVAISSRIF